MKIREIRLNELSMLQARAYVCEFGGEPNPTALILEFSGTYGIGSLGNDDAAFMEAWKSAWLSCLNVDALVFDLRGLHYEFGNSIWNVFNWVQEFDEVDTKGTEPRRCHPTALVVSDLCRPGFSTCVAMVPTMFVDLPEALHHVEAPARQYMTAMIKWLGFDKLD